MRQTEKVGFDCIRFKREAQERIFAEIQGKTPAEELRYFRESAASGALSAWWLAVKKRQRRLDERLAG